MDSEPDHEAERTQLPRRDIQTALEVRPIAPMRDLDILRRVKEGLERME
jgi:hypothetical protein